MTTPKRTANKQADPEDGPTVGRPYMPGYGIPKNNKGLLPWSHVSERMDKTMQYWVCTVSPDSRPHATPVNGLWIDGRLYFGGNPQTRRNRNLIANSAVCIHLESAMDVVILHGDAHELRTLDQALAAQLVDASTAKYGYAPKPEDLAAGGTFVFSPRIVFAWTQFPKDATRWQFSALRTEPTRALKGKT